MWSAWLFLLKSLIHKCFAYKTKSTPNSVAQNNAFIFIPFSNQKHFTLLLVDNKWMITGKSWRQRKYQEKRVRTMVSFCLVIFFSLIFFFLAFVSMFVNQLQKLKFVPFWWNNNFWIVVIVFKINIIFVWFPSVLINSRFYQHPGLWWDTWNITKPNYSNVF